MKIRELMSTNVVRIHPEEPVEVAARTLTQYNIGALPVCGRDGALCGMVTDRDLVIRCMASGRNAEMTKVRDVMSTRVVSAAPDLDADAAARLMGNAQVRRLPVVENGRLCGMLSIGDLARRGENVDAALTQITKNVRNSENF